MDCVRAYHSGVSAATRCVNVAPCGLLCCHQALCGPSTRPPCGGERFLALWGCRRLSCVHAAEGRHACGAWLHTSWPADDLLACRAVLELQQRAAPLTRHRCAGQAHCWCSIAQSRTTAGVLLTWPGPEPRPCCHTGQVHRGARDRAARHHDSGGRARPEPGAAAQGAQAPVGGLRVHEAWGLGWSVARAGYQTGFWDHGACAASWSSPTCGCSSVADQAPQLRRLRLTHRWSGASSTATTSTDKSRSTRQARPYHWGSAACPAARNNL